MEVKEIALVFENCDCVRIKQEDIISVAVHGITSNLWINITGQCTKDYHANEVYVTLHKSALQIVSNFQDGFDEITHSYVNNSFEKHLFEYSDITQIIIKDMDDNEESYYVPYEEFLEHEFELDCGNRLQDVENWGDGIQISIVSEDRRKEIKETERRYEEYLKKKGLDVDEEEL